VIEFKCRPNTKGLLNQLQNLKTKFKDFDFRICYEALSVPQLIQGLADIRLHGKQVERNGIQKIEYQIFPMLVTKLANLKFQRIQK
jgi:hypothetical protein